MNSITNIVYIAILMIFLTRKMYRSFSIGAGIYVGIWAQEKMHWSILVSLMLAVLTAIFILYISREKGTR